MVRNQQGFAVGAVLAVLFALLFFAAAGFGIWAFSSRQDYKNNTDQKIAAAVQLAVQEAETAKEAEFVEREKSPVVRYTGPATYGSVSYEYSKTWSTYAVERDSSTVLDLYAAPRVVPGVDQKEVYALRVEIISTEYDREVERLESSIKQGKITARAYRPAQVSSVLGTRIDGEIQNGKQGAMILVPLRDKTLKVSTESTEYLDDFDTIILPSLTFVP